MFTKYQQSIMRRRSKTGAGILNSLEAAHDLLDKRSHNYSSRPRFVLLIEMLGWENNLAIGPYSSSWRLQRKWIQDALSKTRITEYHSILRERSCKLLLDIMAAPQNLEEHFARLNAAIVLEITYGYHISRADDDLVQLATQATLETASAGK
ncbi:hypothetical protein NLI96_g3050 [Meripilus lineatus]|uniref:Cytochrome P450 n=1 Tax=Meripilus lineatus TaxID=2056292 RepID=A0AAD5VCX0_9APHY|nr:hypothetical protein NLI96_g3050 [Physisporinus lineatus]